MNKPPQPYTIPVFRHAEPRYGWWMLNWLNDPRADYVLAAYAVAAALLLALLATSLYAARQQRKAWQALRARKPSRRAGDKV